MDISNALHTVFLKIGKTSNRYGYGWFDAVSLQGSQVQHDKRK